MRRLFAALAALLIVGCQPSAESIETAIAETFAAYTDTPEPTNTPRPTATATLTRTPTNTPTATVTPTPEAYRLTDEQLSAVPLTLAEMETGFTVTPSATGVIDYAEMLERRGKTYADFVQELGGFKGQQSSYYRSGFVTWVYIRTWIIEFADTEAATSFFDSYAEISTQLALQPMSFDAYGERSAAYRGGRTDGRQTTDATELLIQQQNLVAGVTMTTYEGAGDIEEFERYVLIFVERLDQVLAGELP